jgi:outer membrane lipoprotein-sorting protein
MSRVLQSTVAVSLALLTLVGRTTVAANASSTASLTVDQIIDKYVAARGGAEAWHNTQTMGWTGHVESGPGGSSKTPFLMLFKRPDATRFEVVVQGQHTVRAFDGNTGWKLQPNNSGVPELKHYSAEELSYARDVGGLDGPLFDYQAKGVKVVLQGKESVAGHDAYRLALTLPSGQTRIDWIDARSFLELKYDREGHAVGGRSRTVSVYYDNYQTVTGLVMPFMIRTESEGAQDTDKMVIEKIAINPDLTDGTFSEPAPSMNRHKGVVVDTRR